MRVTANKSVRHFYFKRGRGALFLIEQGIEIMEIGKYNKLKIKEASREGVYLDGGTYGMLFLPAEELSGKVRAGDTVEVFVYYDADKNTIATTTRPYAVVGEFAFLKVVHACDIGVFLDWGLPKDLFVPVKEQIGPMDAGESYVVYIYKDKERDHVAASARLDKFTDQQPSGLKENDQVDLLIYQETEFGFKAVVNEKFSGLLYKNEVFQKLERGQKTPGFIKKIRDDGRIDLSLHVQGYHKMAELEQKIIDEINKNNGTLTLTDKSSPDAVYQTFGVSKKKYKMALGSLYKAGQILIKKDRIKLKEE